MSDRNARREVRKIRKGVEGERGSERRGNIM